MLLESCNICFSVSVKERLKRELGVTPRLIYLPLCVVLSRFASLRLGKAAQDRTSPTFTKEVAVVNPLSLYSQIVKRTFRREKDESSPSSS